MCKAEGETPSGQPAGCRRYNSTGTAGRTFDFAQGRCRRYGKDASGNDFSLGPHLY